MADATTVVEGKVKFRDGKKWKPRWCVLKKPSPVADRLQLVLFKDVHEALRAGGKVKSSFPLDGYYGLESGFSLDRETNVLAILCQKQITLLAFDTREYLIQFEVKIRRSMGQEYQFPVRVVKVPSGSRVPLEGVKLLIHGCRFCLTAHIPPRILQAWNVGDLRRYGAVDGKFCFEGGSKCGKGVGGHAVQTEQAEEISEILRLSSLGKSSTAQSSNNRNSQLLDYSLVTPDSLWSQDRTGPGASAVGADQSSHLACCQGLPAGADVDEWGCRKRHSVNVTEYHRASVATFQEKLRQMSLETQERQRLMAIYDVPPKHPRKLETVSDTGSTHQPKEDESAASSVDGGSGVGVLEAGLKTTSGLTVRLDPDTAASQGEVGQSPAASQSRRVIVTSVAGREYCIPRSLNTSVFDSIVNAQVDTTKRKEALQSLHKQETHLRQEIDLLDQMLKVCHPHSEEPAPQSGEESSTDNMDPWQERISTLEPPLQCSTPNHVAKKTASLPPKIGSEDAETEEPANSLMSPNLLSKLEKIPWNSSLNAPLPYVNLAKYDAETDSGFIYLQGGSEADSGYMAAVPKLLRNPAGGSMASLRHRALMGVPSRSFSETHIGPGKGVGCSLQAPQKPLPLPPKEESEDDLTTESEDVSPQSPLSDTLLEEDYLMPPTTYAPPVPYPRVLTTMSSTSASTSVTEAAAPLSDYTPLSAASTASPEKPVLIREPIYANEPPPLPPPRCKLNTPPPELPPKGPALLQRSKLRSSGTGASISTTVPPAPPVRTRSLSVGSQGGRSSEGDKAASGSPPVAGKEGKKSCGEQAYLPMGSPQSAARRVHADSSKGGGDSRPSSFYSSPKSRPKGIVVANRRGNAEVLSGYMDMANMFMEEPKQGENVNTSGSESVCTPELHITEPIVDCSSEAHADSNYMEMSNFPVQPKSAVLKNLEALQTYISITSSGGDTMPKSGSSSCPGTPSRSATSSTSDVPAPNTPPTKASSKLHRKVVTSSTANSSDENVFTITGVEGEELSTSKSVRCVSSSGSKARPAIPFTNLKNFEQKQSKSYVNTYIPAPEVPLPEPPKKEEGFFARLMRRNSKDKSTSKSQESLNQQKNRSSVFERSISEQGEVVEEKTLTRLKSGRRRSASFPNRLSFHETAGSDGTATPTKTDAPPPLPPSIKSSSSVKSSSSTKSSSSVKSITSLKSSPSTKSCSSSSKSSSKQMRTNPEDAVSSKPQPDNRSDNSSLHDLSDDSDRAPLLRQGNNNSELRVLTVLHVQQELSVSPLAQVCSHLTSCSSSDPLFSKYGDSCSKLSDSSSISLSDCSKATSFDSCKTALSDSSKAALSDSSRTELSDSSKTDDEKLIELLKCGQKSPEFTEADEVKPHTNSDHDQQSVTNAQEEAAAIARHVASVPPLIPPKNKRLPLSPVSEVSSPGTLSLSSASPSSPPQHPLLPSAPNQDEAIYMDMKELFPQPPQASASPATTAHLHPYNCPREQKERARATLRITPALEDEEGNIWVPRHGAGEARSRPVTVFESPPPVPSLSSKLHSLPAFSHPSPRLGGEAPSSLFELRYTTPLVVSVDPLEGAGEGLAEPLSMSSQGSCPSLRSLDDDAATAIIRASPAATVLRPRSGREYQVVERRPLGSESLSPSPATQSPTYSSVFTYEASSPLPHKSPASHSSLFSWQSRDHAVASSSSPGHAMSTGPSTPLSRERTPPTPSSASLSLSKELTPSPRVHARRDTPLPVPPRRVRACHRAHSEPWSGRTDFPRVVCHSSRSSPPTTPQAPISPLALPPETPQPTLNYAEIDLTAMASTPPPVELTRHFSRWQKKAPPKAVAIEYTQIDHTATTALKMAGEEHTQSREVNNSLRRGAAPMSLARKNSAPASTKDRKYPTFGGERKLSTCSMDSI